ncbi:MAG: hypothetical protein IJV27_09520 [Prevotella sp.]|nr:hypothetical protein [Prevotella sp.]
MEIIPVRAIGIVASKLANFAHRVQAGGPVGAQEYVMPEKRCQHPCGMASQVRRK